jgi:hypothetical protein
MSYAQIASEMFKKYGRKIADKVGEGAAAENAATATASSQPATTTSPPPTESINPGAGPTGPNGGYKTAAATQHEAVKIAIAKAKAEDLDLQGMTQDGQYQDADSAAAADPVQKQKVAMSQMDNSGQVDSGGDNAGQSNNAMSSMPGQQGGADAQAASNKTSAEGAQAVAMIEGMGKTMPEARAGFKQTENPYARGAIKYRPGQGASRLFKRF